MKNFTYNSPTKIHFGKNQIDQLNLELQEYKNKTILLVNVASKCGFTKQYTDLQRLFEKYEKNKC